MTDSSAALYGVVVVRLVDRSLLSKVVGVPPSGFAIPGTVWAEMASRCGAPHFRTSAQINVTSETDPATEIPLSYHIMTDDAIGYGLVAAQGVSRFRGFSALDELAALFKKMFVEPPSKLNPKLVDVYAKPARDVLLRISTGGGGDGVHEGDEKVRKVKLAVDEVKNMALDNVEKVIQRGQRIDDIVQATDDLQFQAQGFQRNSRELHQQLWWNSMKGKLVIAGVVVFMLLLMYFTFFVGNGNSSTTKTTTTTKAP